MLCQHPDLAFIPGIDSVVPWMKYLDRLSAGIWRMRNGPGYLQPSEAYPLLNGIYPGYGAPCRDLGVSDVSRRAREGFSHIFGQYLARERKSRLCYKYTGWPRIGFFKEIFPDALFIHVVRDGRAVANSTVNVPWWHGWQGPWNWRWGELSSEHRREWDESGRSFVVLAGIEWKMLLDRVEASKELVPDDRFLQIKYEDLIEEPGAIMKRATGFAGLRPSARFQKHLSQYHLRNRNYKWRQDLPGSEQELLTRCLSKHLKVMGYEVS